MPNHKRVACNLLLLSTVSMSYLNRRTTRKSAGSAELMYLLVVLAAGFGTAWWASHKLGMDLSSVTVAASILGLTDAGRLTHGPASYQPTATEVQPSQPPSAPYCGPGQIPTFAAGLGDLKQHLGNAMGSPVECEHPSSAAGDTVQQTTTGLAAYTKLTNTLSFTDGWRHWAITPGGLVTWEGTDSDPPTG
jgi:hypothetical protein